MFMVEVLTLGWYRDKDEPINKYSACLIRTEEQGTETKNGSQSACVL